jgi:regulator of replication initiation timing
MYFSPRTEKTKIIELSNRIENLQNQLSELSAENQKLKLEKEELKKELASKSFSFKDSTAKTDSVIIPEPVSEESTIEEVSEEFVSESSEELVKPKKGRGKKS